MTTPYRRARALARQGILAWYRTPLAKRIYETKAALVLPRRGFWPARAYRPSTRSWVDCIDDQLDTLCIFIGYARSGHTALAAVINGHPEAVIAHELDLVRWVGHGVSREHLVALIAERDRWFEGRDRTWETYSYRVPGATHGGNRVRVIGDKMAMVTTRRLVNNPQALDQLRSTFGLRLRVINVVRNPFDNITTASRKQNMTLDAGISWYARLSQSVRELTEQLHSDEMLTIRHESLIASPHSELERVWDFLSVTPGGSYVENAPAFLARSPGRSRTNLPWTASDIHRVDALITDYEHLSGYTFDS